MVRIVKEENYAVKRNEILDVAQRLVYTKGYEQMTIQDILDELHISKGAFYHYFDSKSDLLEALIERIYQEVKNLLLPIVQAPHLPAIEKLNDFFASAGRWKVQQKTFLLSMLGVWYADENAIVRQKVQAALVKRSTPWLAAIIKQGLQEGVFATAYPEQIGEVVMNMLLGLGDGFAGLLLVREPQGDEEQRAENVVAIYTDAMERVLGAPHGSIEVIDAESVKEWFVSVVEHADGL